MAPGYNQYHQLCSAVAVHTWDEEDPLIHEPDVVSDDKDTQQTVRSKDNPIGITWTVNNLSVQSSEISDDEGTAETPDRYGDTQSHASGFLCGVRFFFIILYLVGLELLGMYCPCYFNSIVFGSYSWLIIIIITDHIWFLDCGVFLIPGMY